MKLLYRQDNGEVYYAVYDKDFALFKHTTNVTLEEMTIDEPKLEGGDRTMTGGTQGDASTSPTIIKAVEVWETDSFSGNYVKFISGNNSGTVKKILSNTADTLTLEIGALTATPDNGDKFEIWTALGNRELCEDLKKTEGKTNDSGQRKYYVSGGVLTEREGWSELIPF